MMAFFAFGIFSLIGFAFGTDNNEPCLAEFQLCDNGVCALSDDDCNRKHCRQSGQYVCPISKTCVDGPDEYINCPQLTGTHLDWNLTIEQRVNFLINNLSLDEKYPQLTNYAPVINRLGIPQYQWRSNDVHSERVTHSTVFPNGCGLGATWSKQDMRKVGNIIGQEARAVHNSFIHNDNREGYHLDGGAITTNSPNVNLVRDPRWGRAQEVYSEDPRLSGHLAYEFVSGLQYGGEQDDKYLMIEHIGVYDMECPIDQICYPQSRLTYNAITNAVNWAETYSPVFHECVVRAKAAQVMCAYNSINGVPSCAQGLVLNDVLRTQWNYQGLVVSDYDAMEWIYTLHNYTNSSEEAVAVALKGGCDQEGGGTAAINTIPKAISDGLLTVDDINRAFARLFRVRLMLGVFDPPTFVEYNLLYNSSFTVENTEHLEYARSVASKSIVLVKNNNSVLPLDPHKVKDNNGGGVALIGPQFISTDILMGNYGTYPDLGIVPILQAMREGINETYTAQCTSEEHTIYSQGKNGLNGSLVFDEGECANLCYQDDECNFYSFSTAEICYGASNSGYLSNCFLKHTNDGYTKQAGHWNSGQCTNKPKTKSQIHNSLGCKSVLCDDDSGFDDALNLIKDMYANNNLYAVLIGLGLNQSIEAEANDRLTIELPGYQRELVEYIYNFTSQHDIPIVCVLIHGGSMALQSAFSQCDAIIDGWYPGQMGGYAISDVIYGYVNPSGRAAVTSYMSTSQLPAVNEQDLYAGNGITYRYFKGEVEVPFGHGMSYTEFEYSNLRMDLTQSGMNKYVLDDPCAVIMVMFTVKNIGKMTGDEVVQMYVEHNDPSVPVPNVRLGDFERIEGIKVGESRNVTLKLTPRYRSVVYNQNGKEWYKPEIMIEAGNITISVSGGQPKFVKNSLNAVVEVTKDASFYDCSNQN